MKSVGEIQVGKDTISWYSSGSETDHCVLLLHGAGKASSERMRYLSNHLAEHGLRCVQFDHSGHGSSSGTLSGSSLAKRLAEAEAVIERFKPRSIIGSSMGGHTALQLAASHEFENMIFFAPAVFRDDSDHVEFGGEWSRLIREDKSFLGSRVPAGASVEQLNLLHIIGSDDQVIPDGVTDLYRAVAARSKSAAFVNIIGGPHNLHDWLNEREALRDSVCGMIERFIVR